MLTSGMSDFTNPSPTTSLSALDAFIEEGNHLNVGTVPCKINWKLEKCTISASRRPGVQAYSISIVQTTQSIFISVNDKVSSVC